MYKKDNDAICHLTMGIGSEKCIARQFCPCVHIIYCTEPLMEWPVSHLCYVG